MLNIFHYYCKPMPLILCIKYIYIFYMNNSETEKQEKINKYSQMINKLNVIRKEIDKYCYQYKLHKEIIEEFETNNLVYFDDFKIIKSTNFYGDS
mgnify:CR=1 FL=1